MCKYCNYDIPLHYLLNNATLFNEAVPVWEQIYALDSSSNKTSVIPETSLNSEQVKQSSIEINELREIKISAIAQEASVYGIPDSAFGGELKRERVYTAKLTSGEPLPYWMVLDSNTGSLAFEADEEEIGNHQILIEVEDSVGQTASSIVEIVVNSPAEARTLSANDENKANTVSIVSNNDFNLVEETNAIPQITISDTQITDSSVGRELVFTVRLDTSSDRAVTVDYATVEDTAKEDEDYVAVNGTITFEPEETKKTITVNTTGTSYLDADENLLINLSNPQNATIKDGEAKGTILPAYAGIRGGSRQKETVTFSFFDEDIFGQGGYDGSNRESNAREPSEVTKVNYRQIFEDLNTLVDREFVEVAETESKQGDIRIVISDGPSYAYAGGHIHLAGWAAASDAGSNGWESPQGVYGYSTLLHELGHAIGMPHSFGRTTSVFDPEESAVNTVMSYTYPGARPATFMSYDIKSLQERYGAAEYRGGDTVYEFVTVDNYLVDGEIAIDTTRRLRQTIWDSDGIDTFDFSSLAIEDSGYRFDLNQSQYQTTQTGFTGASYERNGITYKVPYYGTSIAIDVEIENLINSSSDDLIIANSAANTFSGYAPGLTTGHDVFLGTDELDTLDLSEFSFLDIAPIVHEVDLKIELGEGNSITVPNYLLTPKNERMKILLDRQRVYFQEDGGVTEGDDRTKLANLTVKLAQASSDRLEIAYTTTDGSAKADLDYVAKTGTIIFDPGETSQTIAVEIKGDTEIEGFEEFGVNLLGNYGQIIDRGYVTIDDDDGTESSSSLTISDATVVSGNNGSKAIFEVRIDEFLDFDPVTVDFTTQDNLAIAGQDYVATNGTLVFNIQDRNKVQTIEVDLIGDNSLSRDEDFTLQLSNSSSNATIADQEGVGTILDSTLKVGLLDGTKADLQLASYPPDGTKDPNNLPFAVNAEHNTLTITGDGNGWKEIPLVDNLDSRDSPLKPYTVIEFDFKTTEVGKLHGLHFESRDNHRFYAPWEKSRFFQLAGSSEFGIQDFNNYQDSLGEWETYQIPVGQFIENTIFHDGNSKAVQWLVFAHEGNSDESNSQFRNLQFKELLPISVAGVTVSEDSDVATFTLALPEASDEVITLEYNTEDNTAIAGQDYTAKTGTVTFDPGTTSQTIAIQLNDDAESEVAESFNLRLSQIENAIALESAITATIEDNDEPLPVISVDNVSFDEGKDTNTVSVTVSLNQTSSKTITVDYSTEDETALAGEDYQAVTGTVTFAPGEISKNIELTLNGDVLNETDESFWLNFANPTNATIENTQTIIAIDDDDALPNITIEDAGVLASIPVRNDENKIINSTGLLFKVSLDAPSNQTVKVNYSTEDGSAKAGEDYSAKNKTLTFQPGETEKNVFVDVVLDDTTEADEQLSLVLDNARNAVIVDDRATGTIEETRSLSVSNLEISEDGTEALFTVSLDKPSVQGVFVTYATENGSAKAGEDYTETKGRLFIKAGETSAIVAVPIIDNNLTEDNETFFLNLTKPKYVLLENDRASATITNDDPILAEKPGGIYQNLQLWIKADAVEANDEQKVTRAVDSSQLGLDLVQTTVGERPIRYIDKLNYNSVLSFDGEDVLETADTLPSNFASNSSVFVVTKSDSPRNNFLFTLDETNYGRFLAHLPWNNQIHFDAGNTSTGRLSLPYGDSQADSFNTWHFSSDSQSGQSIFRNGLTVATDSDASTPRTRDRKFEIGRQFEGDIAEVIVFNETLSQSDRLAVDSYLATKYGFTLDQTTPTDYINSESAVIWSADLAGEYQHDIAGIAIDSNSGLSQLKSRSSNEDSIVTLENASDLQNGEALFWSNGDRVDLSDRIWQVQEQGDVGTVGISFDLSQLEQQVPIEKYALQISDRDDFNNSQLITTGRTIEDDILSFSGIDFQDGEYFTLNTEYI